MRVSTLSLYYVRYVECCKYSLVYRLLQIRECKNKSIFVYFLFADLVSSLECFSSNGQSKKWDDDGEPYQCKVEPGAIKRHCVKFTRGNDFLCIDIRSVGATILLIW